jgi:hypothetical protein
MESTHIHPSLVVEICWVLIAIEPIGIYSYSSIWSDINSLAAFPVGTPPVFHLSFNSLISTETIFSVDID